MRKKTQQQQSRVTHLIDICSNEDDIKRKIPESKSRYITNDATISNRHRH